MTQFRVKVPQAPATVKAHTIQVNWNQEATTVEVPAGGKDVTVEVPDGVDFALKHYHDGVVVARESFNAKGESTSKPGVFEIKGDFSKHPHGGHAKAEEKKTDAGK